LLAPDLLALQEVEAATDDRSQAEALGYEVAHGEDDGDPGIAVASPHPVVDRRLIALPITASPSRPRSTHPTVTVCSPTSTSRVSGTATGVGRTPGPATEARAGRDSLTDALPGLVALACTALLVNAIFDLVVVLAPPMPSWFVSRSAGHRHAWRCDSWLVIARFHTRGT
jgi:hypothetical protein